MTLDVSIKCKITKIKEFGKSLLKIIFEIQSLYSCSFLWSYRRTALNCTFAPLPLLSKDKRGTAPPSPPAPTSLILALLLFPTEFPIRRSLNFFADYRFSLIQQYHLFTPISIFNQFKHIPKLVILASLIHTYNFDYWNQQAAFLRLRNINLPKQKLYKSHPLHPHSWYNISYSPNQQAMKVMPPW